MKLIRRPPEHSLLERIALGEGITTEFKRLIHSPAKIARPLSAFANTRGGTMLVGVDDDGRIVGIHSEKEAIEVIHEALTRHIDPQPEATLWVDEYKRRMVLGVEVLESPDKPHFHIGEGRDPDTGRKRTERKVFIREGSHSKAATQDTISLMQAQGERLHLSFGPKENLLLGYLRENPSITAGEFGRLAGLPVEGARSILVRLVKAGTLLLQTEGKQSCYALPAS